MPDKDHLTRRLTTWRTNLLLSAPINIGRTAEGRLVLQPRIGLRLSRILKLR